MQNLFSFECGCYNARAIITSMDYNEEWGQYVLNLLGVGPDGYSFTNSGTICLNENDIGELMKSKNIENPKQLCGMQIMMIFDEEEFEKKGVPYPNLGKSSVSLSEISDYEELDLEDE